MRPGPIAGVLSIVAACSAPVVPTAPSTRASAPTFSVAPAVPAVSSAASSSTPATPAPEHELPLPEELRARWRAIAPDPAPRALAGDRHWLVSDERKPWLFHEHVKDRGGMLVGVGVDQMWLFAGWARSSLVVCLDFDHWVVDLHELMAMMLARSADSAELATWWSAARAREVEDWIAQSTASAETRASRLLAFREGRELIRVRLRAFATAAELASRGTFMSDPAQFAHLAALARSGRLLALRADFGAGSAMQSVGELAASAAIPVRVLYLSNVEYYVPYAAGSFRKNLLSMPLDAQSIVLHTVPHHGTLAGTKYYYAVERGLPFLRWVESGKVASFREHFKKAVHMPEQTDPEAFLMPDADPGP